MKNNEPSVADKLEKIKKLKDEGTITEEEFNEEKKKILNSKGENNVKKKKPIALTFFLAGAILLVLTIAFVIMAFVWSNKESEAMSGGYFEAQLNYNSAKEYYSKHKSSYSKNWYEEESKNLRAEEKKYKQVEAKYKFFKYSSFVGGALCLVSIGTGIIFTKKISNKK